MSATCTLSKTSHPGLFNYQTKQGTLVILAQFEMQESNEGNNVH